MDSEYTMKAIGTVSLENGFAVRVKKEYRKGLVGLEEYSHAMILWVFDRVPRDGIALEVRPPFRKVSEGTGVFSTRSPRRPSPVAVTTCRILSVDVEEGLVVLDRIDAMDNSPVIDIKPYHPASDRVSEVSLPEWCAHWPKSREESEDFDWEAERSRG